MVLQQSREIGKRWIGWYLVRSGRAALWGATGGGQPIQVRHDDHGRLPQVDGQVVVLRQGQTGSGSHLHVLLSTGQVLAGVNVLEAQQQGQEGGAGSLSRALVPDGGDCSLIEQRGFWKSTQGVKGLLQELAAQVCILACPRTHKQRCDTVSLPHTLSLSLIQMSSIGIFHCTAKAHKYWKNQLNYSGNKM
ncbi:hypothetical protein JZ751_029248 [Albula glossodonta]|uniref:Uncharacterized protein n=1 Tax=Albula glossodonta TaxID=121402 RepID=A0A8T2PCJ6_9TELE|nr:hypothetical protein JZ751_029248 [Albula glossodonta]